MLGTMVIGPLIPLFIFGLAAVGSYTVAFTLLSLVLTSMAFASHSPSWCRFFLRSSGWFKEGCFLHFEQRSIDSIKEHSSMWAMHPHGTSIGFGFSLNGAVRLRAEDEATYLPIAFTVPKERLRRCNGVQAPAMFKVPLLRNALLGFGCATPATKPEMHKLFAGNVDFGILPGGMEEVALYTRGRERVFLKNRAGFIKYALQYGYLVQPGYTFGECDMYTSMQAGAGVRMWMLKHIGLIIPVFWGPYWYAPWLPRRDVPLHTVIGSPLKLPVIEDPTKEDVKKWHGVYVEKLTELFDTHKGRFGYGDRELEIV